MIQGLESGNLLALPSRPVAAFGTNELPPLSAGAPAPATDWLRDPELESVDQ